MSPRAEQPLERLTPQQRAILDDAAMFGRTWQRVDQTAGKGGTWFAVPRPGRPLPTVTWLTLALHRAPVRGFRTRLDGLRCNHIEGRSV